MNRGSWQERFQVGERVEVETSRGWRPGTVTEVPVRTLGSSAHLDRVRGELVVRADGDGAEFRLRGLPRSCVRRPS